MQELEAGDKIQYRLYDKKGKEHWFDGVIHGVRRYEERGIIRNVTYLVDTGRDERVDEYVHDQRDREIGRQTSKEVEAGLDHEAALRKVLDRDKLPKSKLVVEKVRQPEQIELPAEHIRQVQ